LAIAYSEQGVDELVFLDISATNEKRQTLRKLVREIAQYINIPFTVGGGISSVADVDALLEAGADKISVNSAAVRQPELVYQLSQKFGSQCIVVAIDAKKVNRKWLVHTHGGRRATNLELIDWAKKMAQMGAGEILFTSMDNDGTKQGFANDILAELSQAVPIPIIASGGAGNEQHFYDVFTKGKADAALAASIFHFNEVAIPSLKKYLQEKKTPIRN